ncbi:MAG: hypothetical protein WC979_00255 [Candidatus Pacearchaeota archaeon]|jgi:hypothetical protein|nr:hypothetical protein [Clostridia bacterium]
MKAIFSLFIKLIEKFLNLTSDDSRIPTNEKLDGEIRQLEWHLQYTLRHVFHLIRHIVWEKIKLGAIYKWKKVLSRIIAFGLLIGLIYFAYAMYIRPTHQQVIIREKVSKIEQDMRQNPIPEENLNFMLSLSLLESRQNYNEGENRSTQYWGMYQMGAMAREEIGLTSMPKDVFLNNPVLQNWAMNQLIKINYKYLQDIIIKYQIPETGGIRVGMHLVTVSGLIAAAHLVGFSAVKQFIESNGKIIAKDGNNKPLTDYLQLNNIKLNFE